MSSEVIENTGRSGRSVRARSGWSLLAGVASMAASLCAITYLVTSDIASAEERTVEEVQVEQVEPPAQVKVAKVDVPEKAPAAEEPLRRLPKVEGSRKKKKLDMGRFEGY